MNDHIENRLTAYHDGALEVAETDRIRAHLESCSACSSASADHLRFEELLVEATSSESAVSLWPAIEERLRPQLPFRLTFRFAGGMAFAAALGIIIALTLPSRAPTAGPVDGDIWASLGYGLVDGNPSSLTTLETGAGR